MKLLLHICCAPDATTGFERFSENWSITGYFYNPNIEPVIEYHKREQEARFLAAAFGVSYGEGPHEQQLWLEAVKGLEDEPEKGERCRRCIRHRLDYSARHAVESGFSAFATTLTTSPHKDVDFIHSAGAEIGEMYNIDYIAETLRKRNGFLRSLELCRRYNLYRQEYCGCHWSFNNRRITRREPLRADDL